MLTFHQARTGLHVKCNFPIRYKLWTLRKPIQGCNKVLFYCCFCKTGPRMKETCHNLLFLDLKQELPFHTTNIEWTWAIKEYGEVFWSIVFWQPAPIQRMWWAQVILRWLWGELEWLILLPTNVPEQINYQKWSFFLTARRERRKCKQHKGINGWVCQERAGKHWHGLEMSAQLLSQLVPMYLTSSYPYDTLVSLVDFPRIHDFKIYPHVHVYV